MEDVPWLRASVEAADHSNSWSSDLNSDTGRFPLLFCFRLVSVQIFSFIFSNPLNHLGLNIHMKSSLDGSGLNYKPQKSPFLCCTTGFRATSAPIPGRPCRLYMLNHILHPSQQCEMNWSRPSPRTAELLESCIRHVCDSWNSSSGSPHFPTLAEGC